MDYQDMIAALQDFWRARGCVVVQPWNSEVGAGTFNPNTFLRALGPEPWRVAHVEPSKRPKDGRYLENPNRVHQFLQYQVLLKPNPADSQEQYLESLRAMGIAAEQHDIRFVEDDWESPTLGAAGLGWEVWLDGMEISQFTYFQQAGGFDCRPVTGELTYGLERIAMYLQAVESVFDLAWNETLSYGEVSHQNEVEFSRYNFETADTDLLFHQFTAHEAECNRLLEAGLPLPAYDHCLKCSHVFNMLDARHAISVTERARYIGRVRDLAKGCAEGYLTEREQLGYPLLKEGAQ